MLRILFNFYFQPGHRLLRFQVLIFAWVIANFIPVHSKPSSETCEIRLLTPTVFFKSDPYLTQLADLELYSDFPLQDVTVIIYSDHQHCRTEIDSLFSGENHIRVAVPVLEKADTIKISLYDQNEILFMQNDLEWKPQRKWTVYLVHGSHHDLGYTDIQANILRFHRSHMDSVLRFCERTADWPPESQFKYTVEFGPSMSNQNCM